ncbi:putative membrane protein [Archangium gephyra]|uniref:Membrane protein n=1 Tax=Archangium gephyra TaxID=48 RepID=A0AAC8TIH0_9BACT|nr:DUF2270 domain-containing protein [Archangium gephyra]AKJ07292.1 Hypothetical protein AA314_08918 [Archangium gephyra]REG26698.1 putative membrane protein [Archangium gephyra]
MASDGNERDKNEYEALPLSDSSMAQLFRGELSRSDTWRSRLDNTTNWSMTTTAAVVSFGFSTNAIHVVFLVGIGMVLSFLFIEARRYRYYDLWIRRVRLLEDGYWVPMLRREPVDPDALRELAGIMERPQIQLSLFSAISTRLNRAYGPILLVLTLSWFVKAYSHPKPAKNLTQFLDNAHIGPIPGGFVVAFFFLMVLVFTYLFVASFFTKAPLGELRTRPRGRRSAMWESFYRPYATLAPRRRGRRSPARPPEPPSEPPIQTPPTH